MSEILGRLSGRKLDPRIKKTRDRLGDALISLIQEREFDEITVQHVLDRADVARATFYGHYRDKNDLLLSDASEFFEAMATLLTSSGEVSKRLLPVNEFLLHVRSSSVLYRAIVRAGRASDLLDLARDHFARGIEKRLKQLPQTRELPVATRRLESYALSGALTALISWWLSGNMRVAPQDVDRKFHEFAWCGLSRTRE